MFLITGNISSKTQFKSILLSTLWQTNKPHYSKFFSNIVKIHGTHIALHFLYPTNYGHSQLAKSYLNRVHTHIAASHQYMLGASKVSHISGNQNPGFRNNAKMGPNESCWQPFFQRNLKFFMTILWVISIGLLKNCNNYNNSYTWYVMSSSK